MTQRYRLTTRSNGRAKVNQGPGSHILCGTIVCERDRQIYSFYETCLFFKLIAEKRTNGDTTRCLGRATTVAFGALLPAAVAVDRPPSSDPGKKLSGAPKYRKRWHVFTKFDIPLANRAHAVRFSTRRETGFAAGTRIAERSRANAVITSDPLSVVSAATVVLATDSVRDEST